MTSASRRRASVLTDAAMPEAGVAVRQGVLFTGRQEHKYVSTPMWVLAVGTISVAIGMLCDLCYDLSKGRR